MAPGPALDDLFPPLSPEDMRLMDEELARLQEIAGRSEALAVAGGAFLIWWGVIMAANAFYYDVRAWGWLPAYAPAALGILPIVIGGIGSIAIARTKFKHRLWVSWRTQAISLIWMFGTIAIIAYMVGSRMGRVANPVSAVAFMAIIFSLITAVMGASERRQWLLWPAIGWMGCAFVTFFLKDDNLRAALFGVCSLACMLGPGIVLARQDQRT